MGGFRSGPRSRSGGVRSVRNGDPGVSALADARPYLSRGLQVVPIKPRGKSPLLDWKIYQEQRVTEDEIRTWESQFPDANLGILTGRISGVLVLDADGPKGIASLTELCGDDLPKTPTVRTGRG